MQVPFVDLRAQYQQLKLEIDNAISRVISECDFILGKEVESFESSFAAFLQTRAAIGVGNGLDALRLSLEALEIGAGDEVILPANTYIATALAVSAVGARPVLVDAEPLTQNIDTTRIEAAAGSRTRAIMPVHLFGQPCDIEAVMKIADSHGWTVIEDACQAHGARYAGKYAGTFGHAGCFSFYPSKNLGCFGDGGGIVTSDLALADKLRRLRNYGQREKYYHQSKGVNSRLDNLQAAVLNVKLKYLSAWNQRRAAHAKMYSELLSGITEIQTPQIAPNREHIFHVYMIRAAERDRLQRFLSNRGISAQIHYPVPIHLQQAYEDLGHREGSFPVAEQAAKEILSLPMFSELQPGQIEFVASSITAFYRREQ